MKKTGLSTNNPKVEYREPIEILLKKVEEINNVVGRLIKINNKALENCSSRVALLKVYEHLNRIHSAVVSLLDTEQNNWCGNAKLSTAETVSILGN